MDTITTDIVIIVLSIVALGSVILATRRWRITSLRRANTKAYQHARASAQAVLGPKFKVGDAIGWQRDQWILPNAVKRVNRTLILVNLLTTLVVAVPITLAVINIINNQPGKALLFSITSLIGVGLKAVFVGACQAIGGILIRRMFGDTPDATVQDRTATGPKHWQSRY